MEFELAAQMLKRGPEILAEASSAGQPRLTELYDEADEWREAIREATPLIAPIATELQLASWLAAHAIVLAVSAVFFEPAGDHSSNPFFTEKVGEAKVALERLRRLSNSV